MSIRAWFLAIRPATLWAGAVPVIVGAALAAADGVFDPVMATLCMVVALGLQVGCNFVNDFADGERGVDDDGRLGPTRALAAGLLTARQLKIGAAVAFVIAAAAGTWAAMAVAPELLWVGFAALIAAVGYTAGPIPLGYHGLGDVLVFFFFGVVAVCGTYFLQAARVDSHVVFAALAVGALATAILVVNNLRDRRTDAKSGKWTLAARFGGAFARFEYTALVAMAYAAVVVVAMQDRLGWALALISFPYAVWLIIRVRRDDGIDLNASLAHTARLELVFGALLAVGALL